MFIKIAVKLILKIADVLDRVVPVFGWEMRYDSVYDCMDWLTHLLNNICLFLTERRVVNNRVIVSLKRRTLKDYVLATGLFCCLLFYQVSIVKMAWNEVRTYLEMTELIWVVCFLIFGELSIIRFSTSFEIVEAIGKIHVEADIAMEKLNLSLNYRFVIIPILITLFISYQDIVLAIIFIISQLENNSYILIVSSIIAVYMFAMLVATFLFQYGGHYFICYLRQLILNNYLEKEIEAADTFLDDVPCDIETLDWDFPTPPASRIDLQVVADILSIHHELIELHKKFTSFLVFYIAHFYVLMMALYIYLHFYYNVVNYAAMGFLFIISAIVFVLVLITEMYKRQMKYTLELMADWTVCYFDPEMIHARNTILLQASHQVFNPVLAGALPVDLRFIVVTAEMIISVVVFLLQTSTPN